MKNIKNRFFDAVFSQIGTGDLSEVMIVGDSLTSDIRGGNNAGVITVWYNPAHQPVPESYHVDYTISDLHEIFDLIGE